MKSNEHRETVMNCLQCHNPLPVTANFCGKCGTTVPGKNKKSVAKELDESEGADAPIKEEGIDLLAYVKHQRTPNPVQSPADPEDTEQGHPVQERPVPAAQAATVDAAVSEAAVQLMDDLKAQIDAVGVSSPVKTHILPPELAAKTVSTPMPAPAPATDLPAEQFAQWQDMMQELRDRMDAWTQQMAGATSSGAIEEPIRAWHDVQDTLDEQGRQLQSLMAQMQGLAANAEVQTLSEQLSHWQAQSEKARQEEAQKVPQVESKLVVYQNEQMQALGQLQQELRAFALAGAQSAGRLMAIEQAVSQLQSRLGVEPGHAVPPVQTLQSVATQSGVTQMVVAEPLEKVERVAPPTAKPAWVNGLMVCAIAIVLVLTAVMAGMAVYNFMSYSSLKPSTNVKTKPERAERAKDAHP